MKTVGYAIVGTGYFGAELGRIMKEQEGAKIVAVLDPENGQTIADELGCDVETDLDTLYSRDDVDAVIVATPNYLHKEPVVKAAEHGVNVFCEKPIALSYQDCDDMVRACQEHGVIFMAGHVMNFFHGVRHAKKLINDGVIGKVLYCHSARNGWEEQQPTISWKKIREKSGGHLYHHIHELDCVQFLMGGMPEEVTMTGGNVAHQGEAFGDEDDMLFVNMQFSDNRYAVLEWGSAFHWPEHYVLIQGTKGAIKIDMCDCGGTLKIDGKDEHFLVHEGKLTVIAHVACNNTKDSQELARHAESLGVDAIAAIPPIYFHLPEYAIAQYWNDISAAAPNTDFVIYNIPQLAGVALTQGLFAEMRKNPNVIGVKNSSMPVQDIQMFKQAAGPDYIIFNGPDEQFMSGRVIGAEGAIGGTYGVMPELYLKLDEYVRAGKMEEAREIQYACDEIIYKMCSAHGNMYAVIKAILKINEGLELGGVKEPLPGLIDEDSDIVKKAAQMICDAKKKYL